MNGFNMSDVTNYMLGSTQVREVYYGSTLIWPLGPHDYSRDYFTLVPLQRGRFGWDAGYSGNRVYYSIDNGSTWSILINGEYTPYVDANTKILWKCTEFNTSYTYFGRFKCSCQYNAMGNIMSLIYGDNFYNQTVIPSTHHGQFFKLFVQHDSDFTQNRIVDASNLILPAITLADQCYQLMFAGCSSLTDAPELPATTLADHCYSGMFSGCSSLTTAPTLPATTLASSCYNSMFYNCSSLTAVPSLPATTLTINGYAGMFGGCTSLTTAPELPATTLAEGCYDSMFYGCSSLITAPSILPATTFPQSSLTGSCYSYMFQYCTSLTTAPILPAPTLTDNCYYCMFNQCTSLNSVTCLATDISAADCTHNWLNNVAASGTFTKDASMTNWTTGADGIPSGWIVVDAS